jgi:uncharacterized tellurite resistance protein B-like protein
MGGLLLLLLLVAAVCAAIFFPDEIGRFYRYILCILYRTAKHDDVAHFYEQKYQPVRDETDVTQNVPDLNVLNCRIQESIQKEDSGVVDVFNVDICGSIHASEDLHHTNLKITVLDITEGPSDVRPVRARVKQWQAPSESGMGRAGDSSAFCYNADLGRLPNKVTTLSDWTSIAKLHIDWLLFARKGRRSIQFKVSILSAGDSLELACAYYSYIYDNPSFGYIDVQENVEHSKTLAVALAFAVSAADGKMYECEIELIKKWAKDNINLARSSDKAEQELDKALNEVITFYREGNKLDTYNICREIVSITPVAGRCEILELCFNVAKAIGSVVAEELRFLKELANWMEIDGNKFRELMEKVIPLEMHEVKDVESILGVTSDMDIEITRARLNKEYVKWNARVTNTNPEIQSQADQMLKLIAEARSQYIVSETDLRQEKNEQDHSEHRALPRQGRKSKSINPNSA